MATRISLIFCMLFVLFLFERYSETEGVATVQVVHTDGLYSDTFLVDMMIAADKDHVFCNSLMSDMPLNQRFYNRCKRGN